MWVASKCLIAVGAMRACFQIMHLFFKEEDLRDKELCNRYICWVRGDAWPSVCHFWVRNTYGPSMHWPESRRLRDCTVDRCCHDFLAVSGASRVNRAGR